MHSHALAVLEFPRVLDLVAGFASSSLGADRVRALSPTTDIAALEQEHARVAAVRSSLEGELRWAPEAIPDIGTSLRKLRVAGLSWSAAELLAGAVLLRSSRLTLHALTDERRPAMVRGVLSPLVRRLIDLESVERDIGRIVLEDGSVRDDASPLLRRLRKDLRASHGELVRILERAMARLEPHLRVDDMSVTLRNGRYVIPIRREARGAVGGIVHDTSGSGATLFVEPPAAVEFGNRIRELEAEEQEEVLRILADLTDRVRPHHVELGDALEALVALDSLYARARFATRFECFATRLVPSRDGFTIERGRHPLLIAQERPVVPFDLGMDPGERTLLVSGPNTGGKTVLLKALGLISALAQSGVPAPASPESRVPVFDDVFADVGDEQSIEASLSTFSAHLKNLGEILAGATANSLVLIDELGSGTDPIEGAALGWAILEELTRRGTMTVATTHLGTLKELASQESGVVNASLQFDAEALAPTYRLIKGIPGRSYGIAIARRLQLPEGVVGRAEERLPQQERDIATLIERLETRDEELARREAEAQLILDDARQRMAEVARRERTVRDRERAAEKDARQDARRYLLDARAEIDRTIRALREAGAEGIDEAGRAARKQAEQLAARQTDELGRLDREEANVQRREAIATVRSVAPRDRPIAVGDTVAVGTLGGKPGRVIELRDDEAVVAVGAIKLTVPRATLGRVNAPPPSERAGVWTGDQPEVHAPSEIDLRGMRVDEAEAIVLQALDSAIRADLHVLRIIHGKGTGVLRERVTEMLRKDTRVPGFRIGAWNEGGTGVTVVELR